MSKKQIEVIAKNMGIEVRKKKKADLILDIQKTEGNFPCYGSSTGNCDRYDCAWRKDCVGCGI